MNNSLQYRILIEEPGAERNIQKFVGTLKQAKELILELIAGVKVGTKVSLYLTVEELVDTYTITGEKK